MKGGGSVDFRSSKRRIVKHPQTFTSGFLFEEGIVSALKEDGFFMEFH